MVKSQPLLKFRGEEAFLAPEGVEAIKGLSGRICPIIFIGDGRGGKSYLASRLLGLEGAFVSSDSADPVTEGIDMVAAPLESLLADCGEEVKATAPKDESVLILDCEGGNNAMAAIRTLVNVFGIVLGTEVVFVANGMATEEALQNLGASLAARSLVRLDGSSKLPEQRLLFVVNKNTLRYEASALESILDQECDDPGRQELRDSVRTAFPERDFYAVPLMGMPDFDEGVQALRDSIIRSRRPLTISGTAVQGPQLCALMDLIVSEIREMNEVSFPSMKRLVIFDGCLVPLAGRLAEEARDSLPRLDDYRPDIADADPREAALAGFDEAAAHLTHEVALLQEARASLQQRLDHLWREVELTNETLGSEVLRVDQEEREVVAACQQGPLGVGGLLRNVVVTKKDMNVESRTVVHRKRGGDPECSDWVATQRTVVRLEESAFECIADLPIVKGQLHKRSPNKLRAVLNAHYQERVCILKDGHFLWWEPGVMRRKGEASGCINFFVHRAEVAEDKDSPTAFSIRPTEKEGWMHANISFTGGETRAFFFDARAREVSRDQWVTAIRRHIEFADLAHRQLGHNRVLCQVAVYRPTVVDVDGMP